MTAVIEGEVIEPPTARRRERNAARALDLLPPSKDEKLRALSRMSPAQQVDHVTELLVHSHAGLLVAIAAQDLPGITEAKAKAAMIQEFTKQLRMGKDMALHAAEFVRRAERGLGVAIREGQERGAIATPDEVASAAAKAARGTFPSRQNALAGKPAETDFADRSELSGNSSKGQFGIYGMTDGVSDEAFEQALAEAREEENLSRANVARKAKAKARKVTPEPEPATQEAPRETPKRTAPKHNSTEMVENISGMLQSIVQTLGYITPTEVDRGVANSTLPQIFAALKQIRRTAREIQDV